MKFRFVDSILEIEIGRRIVGTKAISLEEYFLLRPMGCRSVVPATLMLEALFQLGNFLLFRSWRKLASLAMFQEITIARHLHQGDILTIEVEVERVIDDHVMLNGIGHSGGHRSITGTGCIGTLVDADKLVNPEKYERLFNQLRKG